MKNFNKENCKKVYRKTYIDKLGRTIVVTGRYAYEWTITVHSKFSACLLAITFPNRKACEKELHNKYPKDKNYERENF